MKVVGTNEGAGAKAVKRPPYATANRGAAVRMLKGEGGRWTGAGVRPRC